MNINSLKSGFIQYLMDLSTYSNKKYDDIDFKELDLSDISIFFKHSSEFKTYLNDEINVDPNILSKSISEILEMDIENGKIIDPDAKDKDDEDNVKEYGENPTIKMGEEDITEFLNNLMEQEELKNIIDTDKSGDLNKEEIQTFLNSIKGYDGDGENISLEDIMNTLDAISDGTFSLDEEAAEKIEEEMKEKKEAEKAAASQNASGASGAGGGSGAVGNVGNNSNGVEEKTLDNMDKDELNSELNSAQSQLSDKQNKLSEVLNGTDSALQELKEAQEEAYDNYKKELENKDKDLAKELDDVVSNIDKKEQEIDEKEQEIADQELEVSDCETSYNNAVSTRETLEASLSALEGTNTADMDADKKSELSSLINDLKNKITEAKTQEEKAKQDWEDAKDKLEDLEKEKEELISGENSLDKLNEQKAELEKTILDKYPEIQKSMDAYNDAKSEYTSTKESMTIEAKGEVQEAQDYVNEVQTAINNYDNKQTAKEYCFGAFGEEVLEYAKQFIGCNEADGSADKFVAAWGTTSAATPWCAAFVDYVMTNSGNYDDVPDWYKNIDNKWYCPNVYSAASAAGAVINGQEAQQGDIVLFDWNGDGTMDHIGIVDSNDGQTIVTIEGNTSNQVAQRSYSINDSRLKFCKVVQ